MILPRFHFLDEFTSFEAQIAAHGGVLQRYQKGSVLYEAHAVGRTQSFYVQKGIAKVTMINEEGTENIMFFLGRGSIYPINRLPDFFSLEEYMYMAAVTDLEVLSFPAQELVELCHESKPFAAGVMDHYCRYANLMLSRNMLNTYNNSTQLVCSFLYLYLQYAPGGESGVVGMTQEEIGKTTGLSRGQVTRVLNQLRGSGVIRTSRGRIKVLQTETLKQLCAAFVHETPRAP